ncbi:MAG: hypothetical protein KC766_28195 [Myxococcales bacterium]|nr:hypothetical protein [Myxococcales bacterium]
MQPPVDDEAPLEPFAPPKAELLAAPPSTLNALPSDINFTLMRVGLWMVFGAWMLLVLISVPVYVSIAHDQPPFGRGMDPTLQGVLMAFFVDAFYSPPALCALFANVGFRRRRRWAHAVAVAAYALCCLCCLPLGGYGLWVLLRERTRKHFYPS